MEWKVIKGYPDYMVSDEGQVYSMKSKRLLTISKHSNGYMRVSLSEKGRLKTMLIHRLVYETFAGSIPKGYEVNHKDEDKSNNQFTNLELLTHKDNINFGTRNQRARQNNMKWDNFRQNRLRRLKGKAVYQYTLDGVLIRKWDTMAEAQENGFRRNGIGDCCNGRIKTHKGYRWEYADSVC